MHPSAALIFIVSLIVTDSTSAQKPTIDINNHSTVIQAIGTSDNPLATWQKIVTQNKHPQAAEQAADAVLTWLQSIPTQSAFVPLLKHWQHHQAVSTQLSDDHGHEVGVYLIAARAKGELNRSLKEQTERYIYHISQSQPDKLLSEITVLNQTSLPAITSGLKIAVHHLPTQQQQDLIKQQLVTNKVTATTAFLAIELKSPHLQLMVIKSGQPQAIGELLNAWQQHPPKTAEWLIAAVQQPGQHQQQALGLLTQVKLSNIDIDWLMTLLGDNQLGRTAARVLGKQVNPELADRLFIHWQQESDQQIKTNLLYGLSRNPLGLAKLEPLLWQKSSPLTPNQQQWLYRQLEADYD